MQRQFSSLRIRNGWHNAGIWRFKHKNLGWIRCCQCNMEQKLMHMFIYTTWQTSHLPLNLSLLQLRGRLCISEGEKKKQWSTEGWASRGWTPDAHQGEDLINFSSRKSLDLNQETILLFHNSFPCESNFVLSGKGLFCIEQGSQYSADSSFFPLILII